MWNAGTDAFVYLVLLLRSRSFHPGGSLPPDQEGRLRQEALGA